MVSMDGLDENDDEKDETKRKSRNLSEKKRRDQEHFSRLTRHTNWGEGGFGPPALYFLTLILTDKSFQRKSSRNGIYACFVATWVTNP